MSQSYTHTHSYSYPGFEYMMTRPHLPLETPPRHSISHPQAHLLATPTPSQILAQGHGHTPSHSTSSSSDITLTTPPDVPTTLPLLQPMDLSRYFSAQNQDQTQSQTPLLAQSVIPTSNDRSQLSTPTPPSRGPSVSQSAYSHGYGHGHGHSHSYSYPGQPFGVTKTPAYATSTPGGLDDSPYSYNWQLAATPGSIWDKRPYSSEGLPTGPGAGLSGEAAHT